MVAGLLGTGGGEAASALGSPLLLSITVSPSVASVAQGATQQFTATGIYSDLSTKDLTNTVTWSSAQGTLATISNALGFQGLATGLLPGLDTITATDPSSLLSGTGALTVLPGVLPLPPPSLPALAMTPGSGKARTGVIARGTDFVPGQSVTVTYLSGLRAHKRASTVLCRTMVKADGTFGCTGTIPRRIRAGKRGGHTVVATEPSESTSTATFMLLK